jgi:hypothetical protein
MYENGKGMAIIQMSINYIIIYNEKQNDNPQIMGIN